MLCAWWRALGGHGLLAVAEAIARIQACLEKHCFSKESAAAPAKAAQCQQTARMVESPAGIAALPTANPLREHGNRTVPLAQLLLKHTLININPIWLQNSPCIFHTSRTKPTALPRIILQHTEWRNPCHWVCWEVNKTLAPLRMTGCFVFCSFKSTDSPWEQAGKPMDVWGLTAAHGARTEPSFRAPDLISVPNPMFLSPGAGCVA